MGGWSAGANIAAVACQLARDAGGPDIAGQVLMTPVVDAAMDRPSYVENAEGYVLTAPLMRWFWDHYADPADRGDPKASPLRGTLSGLPPALVVTAEFDPLRDEGIAFADALAAAGVPVRHLAGPGARPHLPDHGRRRAVRGRRQGSDERRRPELLRGARPGPDPKGGRTDGPGRAPRRALAGDGVAPARGSTQPGRGKWQV